MMPLLRRCCALGLAAVLACVGEEDRVHEGAHVTLVVDPAREPCGDLLGHMDEFVEGLAEYLGVSIADLRLTFVWYSWERYMAESNCGGSLSCASGTTVRSTAAPLDFELARLVLGLVGSPPPFFSAGAAMIASDALPFAGNTLPGWGDVQEQLALGGALDSQQYALAGAFTRFLIDRHGLAAYLKFYASVERRDPLPRIEAVHAEQFGESLTETVLAFDAEGRRWCSSPRFRLKLFECSAPAIPWDGDSLLLRRSLTCGDPDVVGPFGDQTARVFSTLEVAAAGYFELSLASDEPQAVMALGSCGGCDNPIDGELEVGHEPVRAWLAAGRYYLNLSGDVAAATTVALRLERVEGP